MFVSKQITTFLMTVCIASTVGLKRSSTAGLQVESDEDSTTNPMESAIATDGNVTALMEQTKKDNVALMEKTKKDIAVNVVIDAVKEKEQAIVTKMKKEKEDEATKHRAVAKAVAAVEPMLEKKEEAIIKKMQEEKAFHKEVKMDEAIVKSNESAVSASEESGIRTISVQHSLSAATTHEVTEIREYSPKGKENSATPLGYELEDIMKRYMVKTPKVANKFTIQDAPELSESMQWQCKWVCFIVGSIIAFTVWWTQVRSEGATRWNVDGVLKQELRGVEIPGVGNPISQRKRLSSKAEEMKAPCEEDELL